MKNIGNAKSDYSKKEISRAFFYLLEKKPYEIITITELCTEAGVSRRTFYRNFYGKLDILQIKVDTLIYDYLQKLKQSNNFNFNEIVEAIFSTAETHLDFLNTLIDNKLFYLVTDPLLDEIIKFYKINRETLYKTYGHETIENMLIFSFGGFENILKKWIKSENRPSIQEVQKKFNENIQVFTSLL